MPVTRITVNDFIDRFFWYQKYLPQENIAELYALRNSLIFAKANDDELFEGLSDVLNEQMHDLDNKVYERLQRELIIKNKKMNMLIGRYEADAEIQELDTQYKEFKAIIGDRNYPQDDACFDKIEDYYSWYITRLGYVKSRRNSNNADERSTGDERDYTVKPGDYFRKIAVYFYNAEHEWRRIYNANRNNKSLLPKPENPDLIYPDARISIPPLTK
jgi:hypothetical protein